MKNIRKFANQFLRETKGDTEYTTLCEYIKHKGYLLSELHTKRGDELLHKYDCYGDCADKYGTTILRSNNRIVAVNSKLSITDKKYVLLHEIAHILIHFANKDDFENLSVIQRDNEAEAFAYEVLRLQKYKIFYSKASRAIAMSAVMCILISFSAINLIQSSEDIISAAMQTTAAPQAMVFSTPTVTPESTPVPQKTTVVSERYVYTLRKSEVYHKDTCYHLNISNALKLTISEAENIDLRPCKDCDPDKE